MVTTYTNHLNRHRVIEIDEKNNVILRTRLKPEEFGDHPEKTGLVNTGFLIIEKRAIDYFDANHSKDWGGIIDPLCEARQFSAHVDKRIVYFNIGTKDEFQEANEYLKQNS